MNRYTYLGTPIGRLTIVENDEGLLEVRFQEDAEKRPPAAEWRFVAKLEHGAEEQLRSYFGGELTRFDLPLQPEGTPFQLQVWRWLAGIPFGETRTYLEVAEALGDPKSVRAVGAANGRNPLPIVVPCHRVIGRNGSLTGYAGGLEIKRRLLELELPGFGLGPLFSNSAR
jgi:methylated-DNA-[protein]-cysteine S-methyltransferase